MDTNLETILERFTPTTITAPTADLPEDVQRALPHLIHAMKGMDDLYRAQICAEGPAIFEKLGDDKESDLAKALHHFNGPYDKLNDGKCFVEGVPDAKPQKTVYPADIQESEFDNYVAANPDNKEELLSPYTRIERKDDNLVPIPYENAYSELLKPVSDSLIKAADEVKDQKFKQFLTNRAKALTGTYDLRNSDAEWVRLTDAPLEVVIGPFEVYEDDFKGVKSFYEGMLLQIDFEAGSRLKEIENNLSELAKVIPVPEGSKAAMGGMAPMVVADEIIATGEGYTGILAAAFNLPNDPWVRGEVGWKQVMIKNVMEAKFKNCSAPIGKRMLADSQVDAMLFDSYFHFVLLHEVSHGLGPAYRADGRSTNEACGKHYTPLEEAKADIGSLVILLEKNGSFGIPEFPRESIGASFLAGLYRSIRFGLHEAHGKANVLEYNYLKRAGALVDEEGTDKILVDHDKLPIAARELLTELVRLQAIGTTDELVAFLNEYGKAGDDLVKAVDSLSDLPIDIRPIYSV